MLIIMRCRGVPRPLGSQGTAPAGEKDHNNGTAAAPGAKPKKNTTTAPRRRPRRKDPKDLRRTPAHSDDSMMILKTTRNTNRKNIHVHAPTYVFIFQVPTCFFTRRCRYCTATETGRLTKRTSHCIGHRRELYAYTRASTHCIGHCCGHRFTSRLLPPRRPLARCQLLPTYWTPPPS